MSDSKISLDDLIAKLRKVFGSNEVNIESLSKLLESYESNPGDWEKYAIFSKNSYTRNLVDTGNGKYNLIILCWGESQGSAIHDHANSHCFMKMLQGSLREVRFSWPKGDNEVMEETSRKSLELNSVCYMSDELGLHRVENPSNVNPAVSLHLYSPPYDTCHAFDKNTGHKTACQVTFWSKYGKKEAERKMTPENN